MLKFRCVYLPKMVVLTSRNATRTARTQLLETSAVCQSGMGWGWVFPCPDGPDPGRSWPWRGCSGPWRGTGPAASTPWPASHCWFLLQAVQGQAWRCGQPPRLRHGWRGWAAGGRRQRPWPYFLSSSSLSPFLSSFCSCSLKLHKQSCQLVYMSYLVYIFFSLKQ